MKYYWVDCEPLDSKLITGTVHSFPTTRFQFGKTYYPGPNNTMYCKMHATGKWMIKTWFVNGKEITDSKLIWEMSNDKRLDLEK